MPSHAFVAYYPFDTLDVVSGWDLAEKRSQFAKRLDQAADNVRFAVRNMKLTDHVGFFAVPEYYFLRKYEVVNRQLTIELFSELERDELLGWLISLSDQYNRIVILPGTISWRRSLAAPVSGKQGQLTHEGLSSTPVLHGGRLVHTYDKVMNDRSIDTSVAATRFAAGTQSPVFRIGALTCGLEICGDFNEGNLARSTGPRSLDFEFMMSATNYHMFNDSNADKVPVKDGGYFLHVDQSPAKAAHYNGVWCVNRGSGWHGINVGSDVKAVDPWTLQAITSDAFGKKLGVGSFCSMRWERNYQIASAICLPTQKAFAGLKLCGDCRMTRPIDAVSGQYEITLDVTLMRDQGTADFTGRNIEFSADRASVQPGTAATDNQGKASAAFRIHKDQPARVRASFHGAKIEAEVKIAWLGPGFVSRMATLKGTPHSEVPTFYTPIP